jgi:hypothetical protein
VSLIIEQESMMTTRNRTDFAELNGDTLRELVPTPPLARPRSREVCFLDFKDGPTDVAVKHGPIDPSRIWITLRGERALVQISVEEGVAQQIAAGLANALPTFQAIRSRIP